MRYHGGQIWEDAEPAAGLEARISVTELRNDLSGDSPNSIDAALADIHGLEKRVGDLREKNTDLDDRLRHAAHALRMISQVQPTEEGARMAKGIAEEALSVGLD